MPTPPRIVWCPASWVQNGELYVCTLLKDHDGPHVGVDGSEHDVQG
jgi:hypothetical protein